MSKKIICEKGHKYDGDIYNTCPFCAEDDEILREIKEAMPMEEKTESIDNNEDLSDEKILKKMMQENENADFEEQEQEPEDDEEEYEEEVRVRRSGGGKGKVIAGVLTVAIVAGIGSAAFLEKDKIMDLIPKAAATQTEQAAGSAKVIVKKADDAELDDKFKNTSQTEAQVSPEITETPEPTPIPTAEDVWNTEKSQKYASALGVYVVEGENTALQNAPGEDTSDIILPLRMRVVVLEEQELETGTWCKIDHYGKEGWVPAASIRKVMDQEAAEKMGLEVYVCGELSDTVNLYKDPSDTAEIVMDVPYGTTLDIEEMQEGFGHVKYEEAEGWIDLLSVDYYYSDVSYQVNSTVTDGLNIRKEPSVDGEILEKAYADEVYIVKEFQNGWAKIEKNEQEGWVVFSYLCPYVDGQTKEEIEENKETEEQTQEETQESTEPVYTEPVYTEPVYTEPTYTEPVYTQPVQTETTEDTQTDTTAQDTENGTADEIVLPTEGDGTSTDTTTGGNTATEGTATEGTATEGTATEGSTTGNTATEGTTTEATTTEGTTTGGTAADSSDTVTDELVLQ